VTSRRIKWDDLPLFATDEQIGAALLGPSRWREWEQMAPIRERAGLPPIDPTMGGRYVPAVRAYFDNEYGLVGAPPTAPKGIEGPWNAKRQKLPA
jgi:hypothetical protein